MKKSLVILFIVTLSFSVIASEKPYIKESGGILTSIKLYNSKNLDKSFDLEFNSYKFRKSQTARVSWELFFSYNKLSRECELPIVATYHKADSTVIYRNEYTESIERNLDWSTCSGGWGWDEKGNWIPANYFIEFFAGDVYLGRKYFEIVNDRKLPYIESLDAYVKDIKIYENSSQSDKNEKLRYKSYFFLSKMRKVAWQVELEHDAFSSKVNLPLTIILCKSDDTIVQKLEQNQKFKKGWENSLFYGAWGWDEIGFWSPGIYYLDLYSEGVHLGRREFEVINDLELYHIEPLNAYVEPLKLFNLQEPVKTEDGLLYKTSFKQQYVKDIGWHLTLRHIETKDFDFEIRCKFFDMNNNELSNQSTTTIMQKDWFTSRHMGSWGMPIIGRWKQGRYRVELYIDNVLIATAPFEILP